MFIHFVCFSVLLVQTQAVDNTCEKSKLNIRARASVFLQDRNNGPYRKRVGRDMQRLPAATLYKDSSLVIMNHRRRRRRVGCSQQEGR